MATATRVIPNFYRDSVSLMQISSRLAKLPGMRQASAIMASEANLALLREAGLVNGAIAAGPNDLLIALDGGDDATVGAAMEDAVAALDQKPPAGGGGPRAEPPRSLEMGLGEMPGGNFALISTPGDYATAEAMKALRLGLNVMLFSDNIPVADEIALKTYARDHGRIVMGPDCGTAIIGGIPLGFANVVRRGPVGIVAASGTGLQQVACLVDGLGVGISEAIGTGGHDLSREVGGITMLEGLEALAGDPETKVIVLVSKPPSPEVAGRVIAAAKTAAKPVVVNFLGADPTSIAGNNLTAAATLEDAAYAAVRLATGRAVAPHAPQMAVPRPAGGRRFIRGLYSGGTFCYEAALLLGDAFADVHSNTPAGKASRMADVWQSSGHTLVDLGDDVFTRGRPHPMIDHRLRTDRILKEAADPETAVILLDLVLGYGAHSDPAPEIVGAIEAARALAPDMIFVGFVCGTVGDPQGLARQDKALADAGVILAGSNAAAVRLAARIAGAAP